MACTPLPSVPCRAGFFLGFLSCSVKLMENSKLQWRNCGLSPMMYPVTLNNRRAHPAVIKGLVLQRAAWCPSVWCTASPGSSSTVKCSHMTYFTGIPLRWHRRGAEVGPYHLMLQFPGSSGTGGRAEPSAWQQLQSIQGLGRRQSLKNIIAAFIRPLTGYMLCLWKAKPQENSLCKFKQSCIKLFGALNT